MSIFDENSVIRSRREKDEMSIRDIELEHQASLGQSNQPWGKEENSSNNSRFFFGSSIKYMNQPRPYEKKTQLIFSYVAMSVSVLMFLLGVLQLLFGESSKHSSYYYHNDDDMKFYIICFLGLLALIISFYAINHYKGESVIKKPNKVNDYVSIVGNRILGYGLVKHTDGEQKKHFSIFVTDLCGATLYADGDISIELEDGIIFCKALAHPEKAVHVLNGLAANNKDNSTEKD